MVQSAARPMALKLQAFTRVLLAMLVGTALQLAQPRLWPWQGYAALGVLGLLLCGAAWRWRRAGPCCWFWEWLPALLPV